MRASSGWVAVARLTRTRGSRGELLAESLTGVPGRLENLRHVVLERDGQRRPSEIERVWHHDGRPVFKFAGIDSIGDAEVWAGAEVLAEPVSAPAGEFFQADLVGCRIVEVGSGKLFGVVAGLEEYGGAARLRVAAPDGREILIPFVRAICREIDIAGREIRVVLPEGLTDLE